MASIGQLVLAVSVVSGLENASVKLMARYLREAGLIAQNTTGAGAARMTSTDAANLLLAVNTANLAKDAAEAALEYGGLTLDYLAPPEVTGTYAKYLQKELRERPSFSEALSYMIDLYAEKRSFFTSIELRRPSPQVILRVWEADDELNDIGLRVAHCVYTGKSKPLPLRCDRVVHVVIGHRTLIHIAEELAI